MPDRGQSYGVEHLLASFSGPLQTILQKQLELTEERISFLLSMGSIYVKNQRCLENVHIEAGTYLRVHQNPRRFPIQNFLWPEQKVYEDENFFVIDKPAGLPVPATVDNRLENIANLLAQKTKSEIFVTHRLDMGTSGLLILAKNKKSQSQINRQLMNGEIQKHYRALVHGTALPLGEWLHYMEPSPRAPKSVSLVPHEGWAPCRLILHEQVEVQPGLSEVTVELITGRTHQIRSQLSFAGFPIVGDQAYGSTMRLAEYEKICLQAFELQFYLLNHEKKSLRLTQNPWNNPNFPSPSGS